MTERTNLIMTLFVFFTALLVSCGNEVASDNGIEQQNELPEVGDGGFLSGDPCGPPCFWNIIPGVSTVDETIAVFEAKNIADICTQYNNEEAGTRGVACFPGVDLGIGFRLDEDIVTEIGYRTSKTITVRDVIEKYGEPSAVFVEYSGLPDQPYRSVMMLYYDDIFTRLHLPEQESGVFELTPSVEIQDIVYFDMHSYARIRQRFSSAWNGYGQYAPNHP